MVAQRWLDEETTALLTGTFVDPKTARTTVEQWCATWLERYGTRHASTVRLAHVHVAQIVTALGPMPLGALRPSHVRAWTAKLASDGQAPSYVYAPHARLSQILEDAVHDGVLARNPCSRRTSPGAGRQRPYVATTEQVWALHDALPAHLAPAVLPGAFVGLRTAEAVGLRVQDVDFMRGVVRPTVQWPGTELKTDTSRNLVPIPSELDADDERRRDLAVGVPRPRVVGGGRPLGRPNDPHGRRRRPLVAVVDRARCARAARGRVGLPDAFRLPARVGEDDARLLRAPLARRRRVRTRGRRCGADGACGLVAD